MFLKGMDQGAAPHEDGADLVLPQHTAFHQQLLPYVSLMGWLRNSNPVIFNELYKVGKAVYPKHSGYFSWL